MGLLTDIFVAAKSDVLKMDPQRLPKGLDVVQLKGVDPVTLAALAGAVGVTGKKDPEEWLEKGLPRIAGDEEGPWIHELSKPFVKALADLDAAGRKSAGAAWAKTSAIKPKDCASIVDKLSPMAARAVDGKRSMFLWVCL